ncbi:MAG: tetratricopeptide repeat protein [Terriglobia bacterium]
MSEWQNSDIHLLDDRAASTTITQSLEEDRSPFLEKPRGASGLRPWIFHFLGEYGVLFAILLFTFGLYLFSLPKEFTNWDDPEYILNNPLIRSLNLTNLNRILTEPYFANYAPVTLLSYAVDYQLFGLKAAGYHFHNVLLHLACAVALYFLLLKLGLSKRVVQISALLFAIHPVNVESVSWASERKNLLATLFFLVCFYLYIGFRESGSRSHYLGALLCFQLSILSKASTVVGPLVFLLYDYCFQGKKLRQLTLYDKIPFIISAEVITFFSINAAGARSALHSYHTGGPWLSLFAAGDLFRQYFELMFWPTDLSALYIALKAPSWWDLQYWWPFLLTLGTTALLWLRSKKLLFYWGFFVIFLIPVLNIVPLPVIKANRYLHISEIGIWVLLASALTSLWNALDRWKLFRGTVAALAGLWFALLVGSSIAQAKVWRNTPSLWNDVIAKNFYNEVAHYNLGLYEYTHHNVNRAGLEYKISLAINPTYHLSLIGMGGYYIEKNKLDQGIERLYRAVNLNPDADTALNNLGSAYVHKGDVRRALYMFFRATYVNPGNVGSHDNIAVLYLRMGENDAAMVVAKEMIRKFPDLPDGYFRLGFCHEAKNQFKEALLAWEQARMRAVPGDEMIRQIQAVSDAVREKMAGRQIQGAG